jgi:hypothetical protein
MRRKPKSKLREPGRKPRPHKADAQYLGVAPSLAAAATRMQLRWETLRAAKNSGCKAFKTNNTVDLDLLKEWLASQPDLVDLYEKMPNKETEEAMKTRAERKTKEALYLKVIKDLIPMEQARRAMSAIAALYGGKLYALRDRLVLKFGLDKEQLTPEFDAVMKPLEAEERERLLASVAKNVN